MRAVVTMVGVAAGFMTMTGAMPGRLLAQGAKPVVALDKAALAAEAKSDGRQMMLPPAGQKFLWVKATASTAQTIDLTKVAVTSGASAYPLIGVDSAFDGDPSQFSMISPFKLKDDGKTSVPYEMTKSVGTIAFAYTPGKLATVKVNTPPVSFCLLFAVPAAFKTGQVKGLGASDLPLPALGPGL